jgi:hypothetical protein
MLPAVSLAMPAVNTETAQGEGSLDNAVPLNLGHDWR